MSRRIADDYESMSGRSRISVRRGAIGVLEADGRFLMVQRAPGVARPGTWCFPGGHVERGETPRRAAIREVQEELGVVATPTQRLGGIRSPDGRYVLAAWLMRIAAGEIRPARSEISDYRWVRIEEITEIPDGLPSNSQVAEFLRRLEPPGEPTSAR